MSHVKLQLFLLIILALSNIYVIHLIRKNILDLKNTLIWLLLGVCLILFTLFPDVWVTLSSFFGIIEPVNMLFLFSILILFAILFYQTIENAKKSKREKALAQEIAILKNMFEKQQLNEKRSKEIDECNNRFDV